MPSDLTGTVTSAHDPKPPELPPLPEAILLLAMPGWEDWERTSSGALADMQAEAAGDAENGFATRIVTIQPPPSAREVSDAEVCAIIRDTMERLGMYRDSSDTSLLRDWHVAAACVRAALKGAANAE